MLSLTGNARFLSWLDRRSPDRSFQIPSIGSDWVQLVQCTNIIEALTRPIMTFSLLGFCFRVSYLLMTCSDGLVDQPGEIINVLSIRQSTMQKEATIAYSGSRTQRAEFWRKNVSQICCFQSINRWHRMETIRSTGRPLSLLKPDTTKISAKPNLPKSSARKQPKN